MPTETGWTELERRFLVDNPDLLRIAVDNGELSRAARLLRLQEVGGRLRIMVEYTEDATSQDVRDAVTLAGEWRRRLTKWQGPTIKDPRAGIAEVLEEVAGQLSYARKARVINRIVEKYLREYVEFERKFPVICSKEFTAEAIRELHPYYVPENDLHPSPYTKDKAISLLTIFRFSSEEAEEEIGSALDHIRNGGKPFEAGRPIDKEKMRDFWRYWNKPKDGTQ